ncbi:MAG TPA: sulfite oxidase [Bryobacteraceae bacterium]|nr:sulfite oxidase [Bryobacteraceae bacterium]
MATALSLTGLGSARADDATVIQGKRPMILHNDRPEDLETPVEYYNSWLTPNDVFFVRQHIPRPRVNRDTFALTVNGRVSKELHLGLADLEKLPSYTVPATLECTGNGRGFFRPRVPGIQWMRGAVGNAEWSGPRLSDVLKAAGADLNSPFVEVNGADEGVARTPDFIRSFPMRKALHPATLLALRMNGVSLPDIHGGPMRLIVPGWDGTSWVKWVVRITPSAGPNTGFFMNPGYRFPKYPLPPGTPASPSELEVIEGMPVKSTITYPADEAKLSSAPITIRGFAWAGEEKVERVEVSTDGGARWSDARLTQPSLPFAWRLWSMEWTPPGRGYYTVLSRASDSAGRAQPFVPVWNPSGYLYNAVDRIGVTVEGS